jgi:hypothetical protein
MAHVELLRFSPRKSCSPGPSSSLGRKLFALAQASIDVPPTEK